MTTIVTSFPLVRIMPAKKLFIFVNNLNRRPILPLRMSLAEAAKRLGPSLAPGDLAPWGITKAGINTSVLETARRENNAGIWEKIDLRPDRDLVTAVVGRIGKPIEISGFDDELLGSVEKLEISDDQQISVGLKGPTNADLAKLNGIPGLVALVLDEGNYSREGLVVLNDLTGLKFLGFHGFHIREKMLPALKDLLQRLEGLDLVYTLFVNGEEGVEFLSQFINLRRLNFFLSRGFGPEALAHLAKLVNLEELNLAELSRLSDGQCYTGELDDEEKQEYDFSRLETAVPANVLDFLPGLQKLRVLDLTHCWMIQPAAFSNLSSLTELERLNLQNTRVAESVLKALRALRKLKYLNLNNCGCGNIKPEDLACLSPLANLEELDLGGNTPIKGGLVHLKALPGLRILDISRNEISQEDLRHLGEMSNLKELKIEYTRVEDGGEENLVALEESLSQKKIPES